MIMLKAIFVNILPRVLLDNMQVPRNIGRQLIV